MAKKGGQTVGFWQMIRDVLVTSINKGQLPVAMVGFWVLVVLLRMPADQLGAFAFRVLDGLERRALLGYLLSFALLMSWYFHAKYQRRVIASEMDRLSQGRTSQQKAVLGSGVKSSEAHKT